MRSLSDESHPLTQAHRVRVDALERDFFGDFPDLPPEDDLCAS